MYRTILVPVTGAASDAATLAAALTVARDFAAHLDVLHIQLDPVQMAVAMSSDTAGTLPQSLVDRLEEEGRTRAAAARQIFEDFCRREGVALADAPTRSGPDATAQWHLETGQEQSRVVAYALAADLIVAARGPAEDQTPRSTLEAVLLESGRPLLIPAAAAPPAAVDTIAIAWKPVAAAARAVALAAPFLDRAKNIVVLSVAEDETDAHDETDRLVRNLQRRGPSARAERLKPAGEGAVETLLAAARERAGLLVMGGYGHSRLREWVFGGFTQRVLVDAPLPVLIAH